MAQSAGSPDPGTVDTRGTGTTAGVDKNQRKTGYRPDAQVKATDNSLDPDALIRVCNDPRLA
jgi:hypothetical protein